MAGAKSRIADNLRQVRDNIAGACARAGRDDRQVTLVAITKSAPLEAVRHLLDLGVTDLGESRVQQLAERAAEIAAPAGRNSKAPPVRWHLVGHLQRNKVRAAMEVARVIHSVDSLRLAEDIDARGEASGQVADVLVQVNCSEEPQKHGVAVGAAGHLVELLSTLPHLRLLGLMTMAPLVRDPQDARATFVRLRELFDEIQHCGAAGSAFTHLSMGMSQDYAVAVEEGATMLRIGTALFQ